MQRSARLWIMVRAGSSRSLAGTSAGVQEGQGRGQLPGGTTNPMSTAGVPVLPADAEWRGQEVIIAARVASEPGDIGSAGAACANPDRLLLDRLSYGQPGLSGEKTRGLLQARLFRCGWRARHSL